MYRDPAPDLEGLFTDCLEEELCELRCPSDALPFGEPLLLRLCYAARRRYFDDL